jgi:ABC-type Fe3+ transport system substrate-binding protein
MRNVPATLKGFPRLRAKAGPTLLMTGVALFALLLLGACGSDEPTATPTSQPVNTPEPGATGDREDWKIKWEQLIAAAQAEGKVVTMGFPRDQWAPVFDVFTKKYGITVETSVGSAKSEPILAERKAGVYSMDSISHGGGSLRRNLIETGSLRPIMEEFILPEITDPSNWYKGKHWWVAGDDAQRYAMAFGAEVQMADAFAFYNTDKLTRQEYDSINSIWDFLDPRFKGRIIAYAPPDSAAAWNALLFHPDIGEKWIRRFMSEMKPRFFSEQRLMHDQLISGAAAILLVGSRGREQLYAVRDAGGPIGDFRDKFKTWKERGELNLLASGRHMSVMDHAKHPNAIRLLVNWLYSKEGQEARHLHLQAPDIPPTLREDVTQWGQTNPQSRRVPGKDYLVLSEVPGYDDEAGEALLRQLYDKFRFGS